MKLSVSLLSMPLDAAPAGFDAMGQGTVQLAEGATLADLLRQLKLPKGDSYVTLVNDRPVSDTARKSHHLADNDTVAVLGTIKGGNCGAPGPENSLHSF